MPSISPLGSIHSPLSTALQPLKTGNSQFGAVFKDAVASVENFRRDASQKVDQLLNGESEDLHNVLLATQKAELAFELFQQVRNKVVQAYQEVMRMQI